MSGSRFSDGLIAGIPVALGYFPIAFSFGVGAVRIGLTEVEALGLSVIVYAGAAQFLALVLIASGAPLLVAAFTLIAMNLRHLIYGPALMRAAGDGAPRRKAWAWAFSLTDEVFGAALGALSRGKPFSEAFMFGLGIASYGAWVGGTAAGVLAGGGALSGFPAIEAGLSLMLTALFLALLLSIMSRRQLPVIAVAAVATVALTLTTTPTLGILGGMLAGAAAGVARRSA